MPEPKPGFIKKRGEPQEWLTPDAAEVMARDIRWYWAQFGYRVRTWIEKQGELACIRSDMCNGKPTGDRMIRG